MCRTRLVPGVGATASGCRTRTSPCSGLLGAGSGGSAAGRHREPGALLEDGTVAARMKRSPALRCTGTSMIATSEPCGIHADSVERIRSRTGGGLIARDSTRPDGAGATRGYAGGTLHTSASGEVMSGCRAWWARGWPHVALQNVPRTSPVASSGLSCPRGLPSTCRAHRPSPTRDASRPGNRLRATVSFPHDAHLKAVIQGCQRGFERLQSRAVAETQQPIDLGHVPTQPSRQFCLAHARITHGFVQRDHCGRQRGQHHGSSCELARWRRNRAPVLHISFECRQHAVRGTRGDLILIVREGVGFGNIDKRHHEQAVAVLRLRP